MEYRWNKYELYFKLILSYVSKNPHYQLIISSLLKQYDLKKPKSRIEKYDLSEDDSSFKDLHDYFYEDIHLVSENTIAKLKELYLTWEDIDYFKQKFKMPKRFFTNRELMSMLSDFILSTNNPDIIWSYRKLIGKSKHSYNIQEENKNSKGETHITGMTIFDFIFHKSYINILREYTIEDFCTLTHETMHAIFNILTIENGIDYNSQELFAELEGKMGSLLACHYLNSLGYHEDAKINRAILIDSVLFESSALLIGDEIFSTQKDAFDLEDIKRRVKTALPLDRQIDIHEDLESYISIPAMDLIINIIDYLTALELLEKHDNPLDELIDIKLNHNNALIPTLENHSITFLNDHFATLKKEFQQIK